MSLNLRSPVEDNVTDDLLVMSSNGDIAKTSKEGILSGKVSSVEGIFVDNTEPTEPIVKTTYNTSFVDVLSKSSSIKYSYFRKVNNATDTYRFGSAINGEAIDYTFKINQDNFFLLSNIYANTLTGDIMNDTGRNRLSSGVLEFAIRIKLASDGLGYNWIPSHSASVGATVNISRTVYIDGVLTDIEALANETIFFCDEIKVMQRYTGYNLADTGTPLFDCTTTHLFKDGKLTVTNALKTLQEVSIESGYSSKITGYTDKIDKLKIDNGLIIQTAGTENNYDYTYPSKSVVFYSETNKWAGAIEIGEIGESTNYGKSFGSPNILHFWDRSGNASLYWNWTPYLGNVTVPSGETLNSQGTLFFTTNVNKVIQ